MFMPQIELEEQDLEKVERLLKTGIFLNSQQAVKAGLETLLELSDEDFEKMNQAQVKVNGYCDSKLGNMLGAGVPVKVVINGMEYFKVPVKGEYKDKIYTYGHLYVDVKTLAIDEQLSDSREKIHEVARRLIGHNENTIV